MSANWRFSLTYSGETPYRRGVDAAHNAINDRLAQFGTTQARIVQRTVDDIKAAVTQGDLSETTLDLLGKSLDKFVEQANKLPPVGLNRELATTTSHSGGFAVGKGSWNTGFFNGTKVRTYAENNSAEIEVVGAFANLTQPKTGDQVPSAYATFLPSAEGLIWGVQNSTLTNDTAGVGILRISCVAVSGLDAAKLDFFAYIKHSPLKSPDSRQIIRRHYTKKPTAFFPSAKRWH